MKPAIGGIEIIKNDYQGNYSFHPTVTIGECACEKLVEIGDRAITDLATQNSQPIVGSEEEKSLKETFGSFRHNAAVVEIPLSVIE